MTTTRRSLAWMLVAACAVAVFFVNPLADVAARFSREVTVASGALYGTLRVVNSVMSVVKDADVSAGVGVASVTGSPGQLLQPVTNTIDRMADLLFYLAIASGVLSLVLVPVAKAASAALAVAALVCAAMMMTARAVPPSVERLSRSVAVIGILGAVLLPSAYSLAFYSGNVITEDAWEEATAVFRRMDAQYDAAAVEQQVDALKDAAPPTAAPEPAAAQDQGIFDRLGSAVDASRSALTGTLDAASGLATSVTGGVRENAQIITDGVAISTDLFTASIGIAVAYFVKLLVLPILIMAAFLYLLRSVMRRG